MAVEKKKIGEGEQARIKKKIRLHINANRHTLYLIKNGEYHGLNVCPALDLFNAKSKLLYLNKEIIVT